MTRPNGSKSVPRRMLPICEKIIAITNDVCDRHLSHEYRDLARTMTEALCRKRRSPLTSGQPRTWACGIVYVLGRVNFLSEQSSHPYMTTADLCAAFGVSEGTVYSKSRAVEEALGVTPLDLRWTLPSLAEKNPLTWMAEVNMPAPPGELCARAVPADAAITIPRLSTIPMIFMKASRRRTPGG
jgi:hypothetical protein